MEHVRVGHDPARVGTGPGPLLVGGVPVDGGRTQSGKSQVEEPGELVVGQRLRGAQVEHGRSAASGALGIGERRGQRRHPEGGRLARGRPGRDEHVLAGPGQIGGADLVKPRLGDPATLVGPLDIGIQPRRPVRGPPRPGREADPPDAAGIPSKSLGEGRDGGGSARRGGQGCAWRSWCARRAWRCPGPGVPGRIRWDPWYPECTSLPESLLVTTGPSCPGTLPGRVPGTSDPPASGLGRGPPPRLGGHLGPPDAQQEHACARVGDADHDRRRHGAAVGHAQRGRRLRRGRTG